MNFRSFFLATGAVLIAAGTANAADLTVAEPVDYMRVCEAAGKGYFYAPGTETCLKISGYLRSDAAYDETSDIDSAVWNFKTRARLNINAWSDTEMGPLMGFMRFQTDSDAIDLKIDKAYINFAGFTFGYAQSIYDYKGGDGGYKLLENSGFRSDATTDQIAYLYKAGAFSISAALEQRFITGTTSTDDRPDVVGAIAYSGDTFGVQLSAGSADNSAMPGSDDSGFGVQLGGEIKLDQIAKGDGIRFLIAYSEDALSYNGLTKAFSSSTYGESAWNALISVQHYWMPNVVSAATFGYATAEAYNPATEDAEAWQAVLATNYSPVKNLWLGVEVTFNHNDTKANEDWTYALFRVLREFP